MPVRAAVAAQAREHEAQRVQKLGLRAEGGADAGYGGALVQRERGGDVLDAFDVGCGGRGHAAARVGGKRLQIAPRAFGVQDAQGERRLARTRHAGNAHEAVQGHVEVDAVQVVHAGPAYLDGAGEGGAFGARGRGGAARRRGGGGCAAFGRGGCGRAGGVARCGRRRVLRLACFSCMPGHGPPIRCGSGRADAASPFRWPSEPFRGFGKFLLDLERASRGRISAVDAQHP